MGAAARHVRKLARQYQLLRYTRYYWHDGEFGICHERQLVLRLPDGAFRSGRVKSGSVKWPANINATVDGSNCGPGVATFTATLRAKGNITGCLDDTHLQTVFPPHIWGVLSLG
jgi:hypothetical protein